MNTNKQKLVDYLLNGLQEGMKMEELAKFGVISEERSETEDVIAITRTFTSKDDSLTKCITVYYTKETKPDENIINEYNDKIEKAVREENYELAAELRDKREKYLQS